MTSKNVLGTSFYLFSQLKEQKVHIQRFQARIEVETQESLKKKKERKKKVRNYIVLITHSNYSQLMKNNS